MGRGQMEKEGVKLKHLLFCCAILSLLILTGCWDQTELEERAYVVVLGLDKHEKENYVAVTFQIANPQVGSSARGDEAAEPPSDVVTIVASDVSAAKEQAMSIVTRRMSFSHLQTLIVSEELARSDLNHHVISSLIIDPEVRHSMNFIVSKEKAKAFIEANKPRLETRPHKYFQYMRERWRDVGFVPEANLNRYFQRLGGELFLAAYATTDKTDDEPHNEGYLAGEVPQQGGDPAQIIGSAVFKHGKMIGTLSGRETRIALFLRERAFVSNALENFDDPLNEQFMLTARILEVDDPEVEIELEKDPIEIDVEVTVRLQLMSDLSLTDYSTDLKNQATLQQSLQEQMEKKTLETIKKTQEEFEAEPFLWHLIVRRKYLTWEEFNNSDWLDKYKDANVNVTYNAEIANFGEQTKPAKLRKGKDEGT